MTAELTVFDFAPAIAGVAIGAACLALAWLAARGARAPAKPADEPDIEEEIPIVHDSDELDRIRRLTAQAFKEAVDRAFGAAGKTAPGEADWRKRTPA